MSTLRVAGLCAVLMAGAACADRASARVAVASPLRALEVSEGLASFYGRAFHGKRTASGRPFDMNALTAAHPSYPLGTIVRVTNLENGRSVRVRVDDRGPAAGPRGDGVVIDLSRGAARSLDFIDEGRTRVRIEVLRWGGSRRAE